MKPLIFHPEARAEFDAAAERYESLSAGLGYSFIDEVEAIVRVLGASRVSSLPSKVLNSLLASLQGRRVVALRP